MKTCHVGTTERRLMLFAGRSNPQLGDAIAEQLGISLGPILLKTFANGEIYARYEESIRDADVFLVQSPHGKLNEHVVELLIMIQAAKLASAHRVTAVLPYFPYARQDKKHRGREPISARLVADLLKTAGADRIVTVAPLVSAEGGAVAVLLTLRDRTELRRVERLRVDFRAADEFGVGLGVCF